MAVRAPRPRPRAGAAYARLADLPLRVEGWDLERRERVVATRGFRRVTTVVRLTGGGRTGEGEDVSLPLGDHEAAPDAQALANPMAARSLGDWCAALGSVPLWPAPPAAELSVPYRRWAWESAGLDLALRQADLSLADALDRRPRPVAFVASFRLGEPPTMDPVRDRLARCPGLRLKLDPTGDWTQDLFDALGALGIVDVVDLKGAYRGTMVDQAPDPVLYERTVRAFPEAWVEDPAVTRETAPIVAAHRARVAWDAPVRAVADLDRLPWPPGAVNVKPCRLGRLAELLALYERCEAEGIPMYGGGQFELGPGRRQVQALAALFHPDAPNDVAPVGYHEPVPPSGLPPSPLPVRANVPGF